MGVMDRKSPAVEIIAEFLGVDIDEVREMVYQPTVHRSPKVYSWDDNPWSYYCCPTAKQKLPKMGGDTMPWEIAGHSWREAHKHRPIYGLRYDKLK